MNPFATDPSKAISSLGESALIGKIRDWLGNASPPEPGGIGDDCAVVQAQGKQLITTDPVIYGKHFDDSLTPEQVASKFANRNLSDIAAMGGTPSHATIALALDPRVSIDWINRFYSNLAKIAREQKFIIVGGDISSADNFVGAFMTLVGASSKSQHFLLRHQAIVGSHIYVTDTLGGTRLKKHYTFTPRLNEGQWLAQRTECLSCTDLSDGLGKDYKNLLAPNTAIIIDCAEIPVSEDAKATSVISGKSELYHVFNDGEDFELLFAIAPNSDLTEFESDWNERFRTPIAKIGHVEESSKASPDLKLNNSPNDLSTIGYEHLR